MKVAIYPGSFDPITNGHLDVLNRARKVFDKVIVLVAVNPKKEYRFSIQERVEMIKEAVKDYQDVEVDYTEGLTVDYAKKHHSNHLIRGLREVTDFEYEHKLAKAYEQVDPNIDMVFFMAKGDKEIISSSGVMELVKANKDVSDFVPLSVLKKIKK